MRHLARRTRFSETGNGLAVSLNLADAGQRFSLGCRRTRCEENGQGCRYPLDQVRSRTCAACVTDRLVGHPVVSKAPVNTAVPCTMSRWPNAAATLVAHKFGHPSISVLVHIARQALWW